MSNLEPNTIALITLFATIASLVAALIIHNSSLKRNELSRIRDCVISRLESLSELKILQNESMSVSERDLVFSMNTKVLELDICKYLVLAKNSRNINLKEPLELLITHDITLIPENTHIFRKRCFTLLSRIDKAYFHEIESLSIKDKAQKYYYELSGLFYGIFAVFLFVHVIMDILL